MIVNNEQEICIICLDSLNTSDSFKLKCNHSYHHKCINHWVEMHNNCPICRESVGCCFALHLKYNLIERGQIQRRDEEREIVLLEENENENRNCYTICLEKIKISICSISLFLFFFWSIQYVD